MKNGSKKELEKALEFLKVYEDKYDDLEKTKMMENFLDKIVLNENLREIKEFNRIIELAIQWFPDEELGYGDMHQYGYFDNLMLPLGSERAKELFLEGWNVFALYSDGTEAEIDNTTEIETHDGLFGIGLDEWGECNISIEDEEDLNQLEKKENVQEENKSHIEFYAAACDEFHNLGEYYRSSDLDEIIEKYRAILLNKRERCMGNALGIIFCGSEEEFDGLEVPLMMGDEITEEYLLFLDWKKTEEIQWIIEKITEEFPKQNDRR